MAYGIFRTIFNCTSHTTCPLYLYCLLGIECSEIRAIFKKGFPVQVQICMIFLAILIGTSVSNFIVDLLQFSTQIKYLVQ